MVLRITLFSLAALLLGAHFLRFGNLAMVALCLLTPLLFLRRRRWSLYLLQSLAYGAAAGWIHLGMQLVAQRQQFGQPWRVTVAILGAVALFTLLSGLLLNTPKFSRQFAPGAQVNQTH